jgi:hypothetical protein
VTGQSILQRLDAERCLHREMLYAHPFSSENAADKLGALKN